MLEVTFNDKPLVLKSNVNDRYVFISKNNKNTNFNLKNLKFFKSIDIYEKNTYEIDLSTDDWPVLYMPSKVYPITYLSIVIILILSSGLFSESLTPYSTEVNPPSPFFNFCQEILLASTPCFHVEIIRGTASSLFFGFLTVIPNPEVAIDPKTVFFINFLLLTTKKLFNQSFLFL